MYTNTNKKFNDIEKQLHVMKQVYLYKNKSFNSKLKADFIFQECTPKEIGKVLKTRSIIERYHTFMALSMCNEELQSKVIPEQFEESKPTIPIGFGVAVNPEPIDEQAADLYEIDIVPIDIVDKPLQIPFEEGIIPEYPFSDFDLAPIEIQNNIIFATSSQRQINTEKSKESLQLSDQNIRCMRSIELNILGRPSSQYDIEQPTAEQPLQSAPHQPLSVLPEQLTKDQTGKFALNLPPAFRERATFNQTEGSTLDQQLSVLLEQPHDQPEQFAFTQTLPALPDRATFNQLEKHTLNQPLLTLPEQPQVRSENIAHNQPLQPVPELQEILTAQRHNQIDIDGTAAVLRLPGLPPRSTSNVRRRSRNKIHSFDPDILQQILNADIVNKYINAMRRQTIDWNALYGNQPVTFLPNENETSDTMDFNQLSLEIPLDFLRHRDQTVNLQFTQSLLNQPVAEILEPISIDVPFGSLSSVGVGSLELPSAGVKQILTETQVFKTIAAQKETLVPPTDKTSVTIPEKTPDVMANQSDVAVVSIQVLHPIPETSQTPMQIDVSASHLIADNVRNQDAQQQETLVPPTDETPVAITVENPDVMTELSDVAVPTQVLKSTLETNQKQIIPEVSATHLFQIFDEIPNLTDAQNQIPKEKIEVWYKNKLLTPYGKSVGNFINHPYIDNDVKQRVERMRMFGGYMEQLSAGLIEYSSNNGNQ